METETNQEPAPETNQETHQEATPETKPSGHPTLGQIVKHARSEKGLSQEELGFKSGLTQDMVSKIELGNHKSNGDYTAGLRVGLNMEWVPFEPAERQSYRLSLKKWFAAIDENDTELADRMADKLREIVYLPHEVELNTTYETVALRWHLSRHDTAEAEALLEKLTAQKDTLTEMQLYYFSYSQGIFYMRKKKIEEALQAYLVACELSETWESRNQKACFNVAYCYCLLGFSHKAVFFLRKTDNLYSKVNTGRLARKSSNLLASCYINTFGLEHAKEILDSLNVQEPNKLDNDQTAGLLLNYGHLHRKAGEKKKAIEYLDKALALPGLSGRRHMELLYQKIWCLLELERPIACTEFINKGKELAEKAKGADWQEEYLMCFNGLEAVSLIDSKKSRDYLEATPFPYFQEHGLHYAIIDFYTFLIDNYQKKGRAMAKVVDMMMTVYNLQNKMLEGGGIA